jgi:glutaminyl-peptide cyclotransferase
VFGNVFESTVIVQIDKTTGRITAEYDAEALVPARLRGAGDAVLNGIAYDSESDTFLLTGKLWPVMYRVRLVEPG